MLLHESNTWSLSLKIINSCIAQNTDEMHLQWKAFHGINVWINSIAESSQHNQQLCTSLVKGMYQFYQKKNCTKNYTKKVAGFPLLKFSIKYTWCYSCIFFDLIFSLQISSQIQVPISVCVIPCKCIYRPSVFYLYWFC